MSNNPNMSDAHHNERVKLRRDKKPGRPIEETLIAVLGVFSALMLGISLSILSPESGPMATIKVLLVTASAGLVAFAVNHFAITKGAKQAAIGFGLAGVISVAGILLAGSGMYIGAYSGLVHDGVHERTLEDNGAALSKYMAQANRVTLEAGRAAPALKLIADELEGYAVCEAKSSCLSQVGRGGYGPVASVMHKLASRSGSIASAFEEGDGQRKNLLPELNRFHTRYQLVLAKEELGLDKKRAQLQTVHINISQTGAALMEALPVGLLAGYVDELDKGVYIAGNRGATARINAILREHAKTLRDILVTLEGEAIEAPSFPKRPGMTDSLRYLLDFAAFAAVIFVAELVLPITFWVLAYLRHVWDIERQLPPAEHDQPAPTPGSVPTTAPSSVVSLPPQITERYVPPEDDSATDAADTARSAQ